MATKRTSKRPSGFLHRIEWRNPYTKPEEFPQCLCEIYTETSKRPHEIEQFPVTRGGGYGPTVRCVEAPSGRRLSKAALASSRKKRLQKKLEKKYPLFAGQLVEQEMAKKPDYYEGVTDPKLLADAEAVRAFYSERYQRLVASKGKLVIYAQEPAECKALAEATRQTAAKVSIPLMVLR